MAELKAPKVCEGSGGHWYTREGQAAYEVAKADRSGTRPTTLRDARKLGLLPSVTTVLSVLDKPQLTLWKQRQTARAAVETVRADGEEIEPWIDRVLAKAAEPVAEAADLGTRIHDAIERACTGADWDAGTLGPYVAPALGWLVAKLAGGGQIVARESILVNTEEGFAGRVDCAIETQEGLWVLDWKSRKTRPDETDAQAFAPYPVQRLQLAAYAAEWAVVQGKGWERVHCANIFLSSTEPGRFHVAEHAALAESWEAFRSVLALWRWAKNFDPRLPPETEAAR